MAVSPPVSHRRSAQGPTAPKVEIRAASRSSKLHPHAFQTPVTPRCSSARTRDRSLNGNRKRTRPGILPVQNTPWSVRNSDWTNVSATGSIATSDAMSPQPFVNTTYTLKGGMETPNQELENDLGDNEFRRRWEAEYADSNNPGVVNLSSNGTPSNGWGKVVFNFAGTVAGKMWNFCTSVPFSGFYAGGGQGVTLNTDSYQSLQQASTMWDSIETKQTPFEEPFFNRMMTPIPGQYPTDDPFTTHDTTPPRPAKRLHTDQGASWMLVPSRGEGECEAATRCNSPRLSERKTPSQSHIPRPSLTSQFPVSNSSIPRRSLIPISRRSSLTNNNQSPSVRPTSRQSSYFPPNNNNISPRPRTYTPMNPFAPYDDEPRPATPIYAPAKENATPLSPEVQMYAARMQYEDEVADESMRNMHQRLQDLIREGQKALKSNYTNDNNDRDDDMTGYDEGFQDGVY